MLKQYGLLTDCLSELKTSSLPSIEKLKLEVELLEIKRVLLDPKVEQSIAGVEESETEFNDLYNLVRYACTSEDTMDGLIGVTLQLQKIRVGLNSNIDSAPRTVERLIQRYISSSILKK
jgi:hypothetical protein